MGIKSLYLIFGIVFILIGIFSTRVSFHDSTEYISMAKELAGISNSQVYSAHSIYYPLIISPFLRLFPSIMTIKIINITVLILIGLVMYLISKSNKSLLLWFFSPIVWYISILITPVIISSLLILISYLLIKKYEEKKEKKYFINSALTLGLACIFWAGTIFYALFFIFSFFYDKTLLKVIKYSMLMLPTFLITFLLDYMFFRFPFYTYAQLGTVLFIVLNINRSTTGIITLNTLWALVIISPLLFMIYKTKFKENKKEIFYLILSTIFIIAYQGELVYFMFIAPLIILLLSKTLTKKQVLISCIISLFIVFILINNYFGDRNRDAIIQKDLKKINQDFNFKTVISGDVANDLTTEEINANLWQKYPKVLWASDYKLYLRNETVTSEYYLKTNSRIKTIREMNIRVWMERDTSINFENLPLILSKYDKNHNPNYKKEKCYELLCVYLKR